MLLGSANLTNVGISHQGSGIHCAMIPAARLLRHRWGRQDVRNHVALGSSSPVSSVCGHTLVSVPQTEVKNRGQVKPAGLRSHSLSQPFLSAN